MQIETESSQSLFAQDEPGHVVATGRDFEYDTCSNEFSFKRASRSGLLYLDPRPAGRELLAIYPTHYEPYRFDELPWILRTARDFVQRRKVSFFRRLIGDEGCVLDFGCGGGKLLSLMRSFSRWKLHGYDWNVDAVRHRHPEILFYSAWDSLPENYFDLIVLNQVIEHLADVRGVLAALRKALKPEGKLVIETPSCEGFDARLFCRQYWGGYHFPRHFYIFNESSLHQLLNECHFRVISTGYLASPAFWLQSLHHFFLEKGFATASRFFQLRNLPLIAFFSMLDSLVAAAGGKTSNMRVVACK